MTPKERYLKLEQHLSEENPVLLEIIQTYKRLDTIGHKTGLLPTTESYASQISWWPLISILGTFSAGKSSFINQYLGQNVQESGNQAIDDKFTVVCYGKGDEVNTLPGLALNADPRFPFFGISEKINQVESGEGSRIDSYLQLKTVPQSVLKGKILIDSPGFDADSQRDSILKITNHIIDMSDLVLVFFDARHPEPGAMRDTLEHLVKTNIGRTDSDKILFILNQIDTAAQEDNPEEVIGAWQRALSQQGLVSGNFYAIYNEALANRIEDPALAERFKRKKDIDLNHILSRMQKVSTERAYRIAHAVEHLADNMTAKQIPALRKALQSWRNTVMTIDLLLLAMIVGGLSYWLFTSPTVLDSFLSWSSASIANSGAVALIALIVAYGGHFIIRNKVAQWQARRLSEKSPQIAHALLHNNRFWRGMFHKNPRGWGQRNRRKLADIIQSSKQAIQKLTDQFAEPSGGRRDETATHRITTDETAQTPPSQPTPTVEAPENPQSTESSKTG